MDSKIKISNRQDISYGCYLRYGAFVDDRFTSDKRNIRDFFSDSSLLLNWNFKTYLCWYIRNYSADDGFVSKKV